MVYDLDELISCIRDLIFSLRQTDNDAYKFYEEAIDKIQNNDSEIELKKILINFSIVGPGKIADMCGFNIEQHNLADDMHDIAYKIYEIL